MKQSYGNVGGGGTDATSIATTTIGFLQIQKFGGSGFVEAVVVEQESAADAEWNIIVDGSNIFASTQSVASADAPEEFVPGQNRNFAGSAALELDVTASSGTSGNLLVDVLVSDERGPGGDR